MHATSMKVDVCMCVFVDVRVNVFFGMRVIYLSVRMVLLCVNCELSVVCVMWLMCILCLVCIVCLLCACVVCCVLCVLCSKINEVNIPAFS